MSKTRTTPPRAPSPSHQSKRYQRRPSTPNQPAAVAPAGAAKASVVSKPSAISKSSLIKPSGTRASKAKANAAKANTGKSNASKPGNPRAANAKQIRRAVPPPPPGPSTPGLVGIGVVIGLTGHIVEQANGEPWWSAQEAYAADAAAARDALLGTSPASRPPESLAVATPADPDIDPRPPVLSALADAGPEQAPVSFLEGLNTPTGLVVPADPAIQRYLHHYVETKEGKDRFKNWMRRGGEYDRMIEGAFRKHRVPIALKALVFVESAFNPEAVSPVGASGMFQFMEGTARAYDLVVEPGYDQRFDPYAASNAAAKHLADLYEETQDWPLALAAYNCGLGAVRARLEEAGVRTFWELAEREDMLPQETRQYVPRIMAIAIALSNLEHYGLDKVSRAASAPRTTRYEPPMGVPLSLLARAAGTSKNELLKLNPQLRTGEMPTTGTAVTLNVKGSWYSRIQSTLPMLMDESVARLDLQVDANFDWGKDEFVGPTDGSEAPAGGFPLAQRIGPGAQGELTTGTPSITPAPILGVGSRLGANPAQASSAGSAELVAATAPDGGAPGHSVSPGFPAPQGGDSAPSPTAAAASHGPIKASPILPIVSSAASAKSVSTADSGSTANDAGNGVAAQPTNDDASAKRGSLLPIRLAGQQGARANQSNTAQSFVPLGVTTTETP